jgi:hypothetical protein
MINAILWQHVSFVACVLCAVRYSYVFVQSVSCFYPLLTKAELRQQTLIIVPE